MAPKPKPIVPPPPAVAPTLTPDELARHQAEQTAKDKPKLDALTAAPCTTCGWPIEPGATCEVDGTVAP